MLADVRAALAFLTVLPFAYPEGRKAGYSFAWFPLVGLLIGVVLVGVLSFPFQSPDARAFVALAAWVILTGGLHLDGFGDSCDALLAVTTPERRLEIMKDPRAGSWAVVGLILLLLGKWTLLRDVPPVLMLLPPIAGRWAMALAAYAFPYARSSGLGAYFRDGLGRAQVLTASIVALMVIVMIALVVNQRAWLMLFTPPLIVFFSGRWAAHRLGGGLTGDVYGAICELTELICLALLSL
jgi:adenosylcobinamide-GDP ribazoletransferase